MCHAIHIYLLTVLAWENAIASIHRSSFTLIIQTDLSFACVWVMTIALLGLKVRGHSQPQS